jgi:SSS family solute:Na+ symporter
MPQLHPLDIAVLLAYTVGVVGLGCWFARKSGDTDEFMKAGGALPGWAVGLSIFGTFLSSNTFLGVPGKAYGSNWNALVFSFSLPVAAAVAVRWFVPFYRRSGEISAYHHFERRFGGWARTYGVVCYLLTQFARTGSVLFGVGLALRALTGWDLAAVIVVIGALVTLYTMLGGIEAVIWTDVAQSVVLVVGALVVAAMLLFDMPKGPGQVFEIAAAHDKFSLGGFDFDLTTSTFWLVLLYGIFINLNNFGIDQSYVQRYHAARDARAAGRSVWLGAILYPPISLLFFFIGASLFAYYQTQPELLAEVKHQVAEQRVEQESPPGPAARAARVAEIQSKLTAADIGDKVFPHFIVRKLPPGMAGLLIAAILAAAMSSIDTSLNSSATVLLCDIYRRYWRPQAGERESMRVLYLGTLLVGVAGTGIALAMIGVESVLEAWWTLSGIFAGGLLGLFLLGMISRRAGRPAAMIGVLTGLSVIAWMTFSDRLPAEYEHLRNPLHAHMTIVVGTLTIFGVGLLAGRLLGSPTEPEMVE